MLVLNFFIVKCKKILPYSKMGIISDLRSLRGVSSHQLAGEERRSMFFNGRRAATPRNSSYTSAHINSIFEIITSVADPYPSDTDPAFIFDTDPDPHRFEEVMYL
jgi:hypothetical protein